MCAPGGGGGGGGGRGKSPVHFYRVLYPKIRGEGEGVQRAYKLCTYLMADPSLSASKWLHIVCIADYH